MNPVFRPEVIRDEDRGVVDGLPVDSVAFFQSLDSAAPLDLPEVGAYEGSKHGVEELRKAAVTTQVHLKEEASMLLPGRDSLEVNRAIDELRIAREMKLL